MKEGKEEEEMGWCCHGKLKKVELYTSFANHVTSVG